MTEKLQENTRRAAVISSPILGAFSVAAAGPELRRGHVLGIYTDLGVPTAAQMCANAVAATQWMSLAPWLQTASRVDRGGAVAGHSRRDRQ